MSEVRKVCVLDVSVKRKGGVNILTMRSDVLEDLFRKAGVRTDAVEGALYKRPATDTRALTGWRVTAEIKGVGSVQDDGENRTGNWAGLAQSLVDSSGYLNMSPLLISGMDRGIVLEFQGMVTDEVAKQWCQCAKNWATKYYNAYARNWAVGLVLVAHQMVDTEEPSLQAAATRTADPAPVVE